MTMVERVARALAEADNESAAGWRCYADTARVAIAAMREPSDAMTKASWWEQGEHWIATDEEAEQDIRDDWARMIDAALLE